jgi:hypothetical protein
VRAGLSGAEATGKAHLGGTSVALGETEVLHGRLGRVILLPVCPVAKQVPALVPAVLWSFLLAVARGRHVTARGGAVHGEERPRLFPTAVRGVGAGAVG